MAPNQIILQDRIAIVEADYGRGFGWQVLSDSDCPLATLTDYKNVDVTWYSYLVTPLGSHTNTQTECFWYPDCQRIRNIAYPDFVFETFGHFDPETNRVTIRVAPIPVEFSWFDRLSAPRWFLRQWLK